MNYTSLFVLLAALSQLIGLLVFSGAGAFETTARSLPTFIQPAGWAFSIWGGIYLLSFIYAIYQVIPRNDNQALRANRLLAAVAFIGSSAWLYLAQQTGVLLWLTIPVLFVMALCLNYIVLQDNLSVKKYQRLSREILYPYAAWTGIAAWLNVQALLNDQNIITNPEINLASNVLFLSIIAIGGFTMFKRSGYSIWYGGVIVWATIAIVSNNMDDGSLIIATLAGAVGLLTLSFVRLTIYGAKL